MPNMSPKKISMPEQDPLVRAHNFQEVTLGYTPEMAQEEAARCLDCKNKPCMEGCPVNVKIPEFIKLVEKGEFLQAYNVIHSTNALPAICGRVCPQETQCEAKCVRGIKGEPVAIGRLERFCADAAIADVQKCPYAESVVDSTNCPKNGKKVAIIGSGPAGLTCAGDLAQLGYEVKIFEALHTPGGVLMYGIPEFRLPKELVAKEIQTLKAMGVDIETDMVMGKVLSLAELMEDEGYRAVFVGSGAGLPNFMKIPGENLNGVYSANEFLTRTNLMKAYKFPQNDTPIYLGEEVAVIGGGNVAMDAARCALRLGAKKVYIVYRRSADEMPARAEEVHHAREEGIAFHLLTNPTAVLGDDKGWVTGLRCNQMELGEPDASGRRRPVTIPDSEFELSVQTVVIAIGNSPNPLIKNTTPGLETNKWGCIVADENGQTSKPGIFAGGDVVTGAATVILAMGAGKKAAAAIHEMLK